MTGEAIDTDHRMRQVPGVLRVALHARDPGRLGALLAALATEGVEADADAPVLLADLLPGEPVPDNRPLLVLLTDESSMAREPVAGVLPRHATPRQIAAALHAVTAGLLVRSAEAADASFDDAAAPGIAAAPALLTPRELEILGAVGDGLSNKAVARALGISAHTVKFHLEAVFAKLDARTRAEAVAKGLRRGLIEV